LKNSYTKLYFAISLPKYAISAIYMDIIC
jgi:hypothetical protein